MAVPEFDLYEVLGIKKEASQKEIKSAHTKILVKNHPTGDYRNRMRSTPEYLALSEDEKAKKEAELDEVVKKANMAFKILSNEKTRQDYDNKTGDFASLGGGFGGFGGFAGFADFGDLGDIFNMAGFGGRQRKKSQPTATNIETVIKIQYKDIFTGKVGKYKVYYSKLCGTCNGKGAASSKPCGKCKGEGHYTALSKFGGGFVTSQTVICDDCAGYGNITQGPVCTGCNGERKVKDFKILELKFTEDMKDGESVVFSKAGNQHPGYTPGNIVFKLKIVDSDVLSRINDDLVASVDVDLLTAISGGYVYFEHPNGKKLSVYTNPFKSFDTSIVVPNEGFKLSGASRRGKLIIIPKILINQGLNRAALSDIIPPIVQIPNDPGYQPVSSYFDKIPEAPTPEQEDSNFGFFSAFR